jgi:hypothetical protein
MPKFTSGQSAFTNCLRGWAIVADSFENTQLPNSYTDAPLTLPHGQPVRIIEWRKNQHNEIWYEVIHFEPTPMLKKVWIHEDNLKEKEEITS